MEKKRIKERKEKLGEEGLKKLKKELEEAVANRTKPPAEVIKNFPLADASKISFWPIESYNRTMEEQPSEVFNIADVPFKFHFDHLDTMFIRLSVMFDIRAIKDPKERILLGLLNRVWLESPIKYNDSYTMEADEVIKTRQADTISFYASQGSSLFTFYTKMSLDKYRKGIEYNRLTMFNVVPSVKLLKSKLEASIGKLI